MKRLARALTLALLATPLAAFPAPAQAARHTCHGHRATISGNNHRNHIIGTAHRDVIWAGRGNDIILSRGGNDLICGGPGRDVIDGQSGTDVVFGGPGKDWCIGWTAREHAHHHTCEVHPGSHRHRGPGTAARTATKEATPLRMPAPITPAMAAERVMAEKRAGSCAANGTCDPGIAACDASHYDYSTSGVRFPVAYTQDGGLLAVVMQLWGEKADGTFLLRSDMAWKSYSVGPGAWELPPALTNVNVAGEPGGVGILVASFSYSGDGGATWSTPDGAIETQYIFKTYSGYNSPGSGNLATGACFL